MKKIMAVLFSLLIILSFTACGEKNDADNKNTSAENITEITGDTQNQTQTTGKNEPEPLYPTLNLSDYPMADVDWSFKGGVLTIKGSGRMPNGMSSSHPWNVHADETTKIVVEEGIVGIGESNFYRFSSLESVSLPSTLLYVGTCTFTDCYELKSIELPEGLAEIKASAFEGCEELESVTLPSTLVKIGEDAFSYCDSLTKVNIPNSVKSIGESAFASSGLTEFTFPESVVEIGRGAIRACYSLESIKLYASDDDVPNFMYDCSEDVKLEVGENYVVEDGILYNKDKTVLIACVDPNLKELTVPSSVTKIADYAFSSHKSITTVNTGENTKIIGESAFYCCKALKEVTIGDSLEVVSRFAFSWCDILGSLDFPATVNKVEYGAFRGDEALTSVTFGAPRDQIEYDDGDDDRLPENLIMTFGE
ncbi:MAG: leucine-rich repeat domain-containing protein [Ruminococcaceae bacterium]|nr:leucine-rich repeat domain-containing protein [Oscillospiraceae bacterium]